MKSKFLLRSAGALALSALLSAPVHTAFSQGSPSPRRTTVNVDYPTKPVRLVNGFAAGGGSDFVARLVAAKLSETWGQQVVVENRPGAGGTVGARSVIQSEPDGYTMMILTPSHAITPSIYKLQYDPISDISPVALLAAGPFLVLVNPDLPVKSVPELIALARTKPRQLNYGSAGSGSGTHLATEFFKLTAGIDVAHVPYKGVAPAMIDLIAGRIQLMIPPSAAPMRYVRDGKLRGPCCHGLETPVRFARFADGHRTGRWIRGDVLERRVGTERPA